MTHHFCDPSGRDLPDLPAIPQTATQAEALAWRQFHAALVAFIGEQSPRMGAVVNTDWHDTVMALSSVAEEATWLAERAEERAREEIAT